MANVVRMLQVLPARFCFSILVILSFLVTPVDFRESFGESLDMRMYGEARKHEDMGKHDDVFGSCKDCMPIVLNYMHQTKRCPLSACKR